MAPVTDDELVHSRPDSPRTRFLAILVIGAASSGLLIWWNAFTTNAMYGGESVDLSLFGNMFFLGLGSLNGLVIGSLIGVLYSKTATSLDSRKQKRNWLISMTASVILSPVAAFIMVVVLSIIFFAMPEGIFRVIFDVPTQ